jgi:hypothetical protein
MQSSTSVALWPRFCKAAPVLLSAALAGCASVPSAHPARQASFGDAFFRDAPAPHKRRAYPKSAPSKPAPHPQSECGQIGPERCLLNKGIIGPRGGGHD